MSRVSVTVGRSMTPAAAPAATPGPRAPVCLVGLAPPGMPRIVSRLPDAVLRHVGAAPAAGAEVLRLGQGFEPSLLPGIADGSRLRDAARLALASGLTQIEVILVHPDARSNGASLADPRLFALVSPLLDELPGALVVVSDAAGPPQHGPHPPDPARGLTQLAALLRLLAPVLRARFQVGMIGLGPELPRDGLAEALVRDQDVVLVGWSGPGVAGHAWRDAAAALAGLAGPLEVIHGVEGRRLSLPPGRPSPTRRRADLGLDQEIGDAPADLPMVRLSVDADGVGATVEGDTTLRGGRGEFVLPALRTVKTLHHLVVSAAEAFVFRPVDTAHALSLMTALDFCVRPFVAAGLLIGPGGKGAPTIEAAVERNPAAPGLSATVCAQLRPWCHEIRLKVGVHDRASARLEIHGGEP